ncbi:uncharacterized protein LOC107629816 [Arachis ipaensis]|uniref:uncharacterized protein LOC107629816 n=1 Tax=Arachis ipaensis TaxID=130454 RepID=UPI000A2AF41A|nr:uncharacterized protein LOC107629816 [Arachis ipaensis]
MILVKVAKYFDFMIVGVTDVTELETDEIELGYEVPDHSDFREDKIPTVELRFDSLQLTQEFYATYAKKVRFLPPCYRRCRNCLNPEAAFPSHRPLALVTPSLLSTAVSITPSHLPSSRVVSLSRRVAFPPRRLCSTPPRSSHPVLHRLCAIEASTVAVAASTCIQHCHHCFYRRRTTLSGPSALLCFVSAPANYSVSHSPPLLQNRSIPSRVLNPQSDSVSLHSPPRFEKMKHKAEAEAKVLPLELVEKILLWLPVKSLIRFRCVSKKWLSLVSDSRFAKLHYDTADAAPTNKNTRLLYLSSELPEACCVDLEASICGDYALQLPLSCRHFSLSILGSCRGFILLRIHVHGAPLLLWNPVTGSHRSVPYPVADSDAPYWMGFGSSNN